jgi:hypothetical protein
MKSLKLIILGMMLFFVSSSMHSQVSISVNLGMQPSWGPAGYSSVNYYYLPDVEAYYDIQASQFIYLSGGTWIRSNNLPQQYRNYNLDRGYKVVLNDYHGSRPYSNYKYHKQKYYKGYSRPQESISHRSDNHENNGENGNNDRGENDGNRNNGHGKGKK